MKIPEHIGVQGLLVRDASKNFRFEAFPSEETRRTHSTVSDIVLLRVIEFREQEVLLW